MKGVARALPYDYSDYVVPPILFPEVAVKDFLSHLHEKFDCS